MNLETLIQEMTEQHDEACAQHAMRFFKTQKGEYGEGDQFLGLTVPQTRAIAKRYKGRLSLSELAHLLHSPWHEIRLCALFLLIEAAKKDPETVAQLYIKERHQVNNWDLVDTSAPKILGPYFMNHSKDLLYEWAKDGTLWERRIAILTSFHFMKHGDPGTTLELAELLLKDKEDLIHKAVGWMLRELGKLYPDKLHEFLRSHASAMPRTMLRYAIERFEPAQRQAYLKGEYF